MQNEAGEYVDLYVPRKCSVTNRVITAKDHASVQINVGEIDETGRFTGNFKTYALCGFLRHLVCVCSCYCTCQSMSTLFN